MQLMPIYSLCLFKYSESDAYQILFDKIHFRYKLIVLQPHNPQHEFMNRSIVCHKRHPQCLYSGGDSSVGKA